MAVYDNLTEECRSRVQQLIDQGIEIYQVDQSIFSAQDYLKQAWSSRGRNIEVIQVSAHLNRTVVMSAISTSGRVYTHTKDHYFKKEDVD